MGKEKRLVEGRAESSFIRHHLQSLSRVLAFCIIILINTAPYESHFTFYTISYVKLTPCILNWIIWNLLHHILYAELCCLFPQWHYSWLLVCRAPTGLMKLKWITDISYDTPTYRKKSSSKCPQTEKRKWVCGHFKLCPWYAIDWGWYAFFYNISVQLSHFMQYLLTKLCFCDYKWTYWENNSLWQLPMYRIFYYSAHFTFTNSVITLQHHNTTIQKPSSQAEEVVLTCYFLCATSDFSVVKYGEATDGQGSPLLLVNSMEIFTSVLLHSLNCGHNFCNSAWVLYVLILPFPHQTDW